MSRSLRPCLATPSAPRRREVILIRVLPRYTEEEIASAIRSGVSLGTLERQAREAGRPAPNKLVYYAAERDRDGVVPERPSTPVTA